MAAIGNAAGGAGGAEFCVSNGADSNECFSVDLASRSYQRMTTQPTPQAPALAASAVRVETSPTEVTVCNGDDCKTIAPKVDRLVDFGSRANVAMGIFLNDATGTAIDDAQNRYIKPPRLNDFAFREFQINGSFEQGFVHGELETFRRVPEPGTLAVLGVALAGLAFRRKRTST